MAFLEPFAPIALAGASGLVGTVGARVGKKLSGLKKGGVAGSAKAVKARLKRATVKKNWGSHPASGFYGHTCKPCEKGSCGGKSCSKEGERKRIRQMSTGGVATGKKVLLHKNELVISPKKVINTKNPYRNRGGRH